MTIKITEKTKTDTIETPNASRIDWLANRAPQWDAK